MIVLALSGRSLSRNGSDVWAASVRLCCRWSACGLSIGEVVAHFEEVYGARVLKDTIGWIIEKIVGELAEWSSRPLDAVYLVVFVDVIVVKVGDGQVRTTPFYVVVGVTMNGERDILGIWAGDGVEGARFWLQIFPEVKNSFPMRVAVSRCQRFWLQIFSEVKIPRHRRRDDRGVSRVEGTA